MNWTALHHAYAHFVATIAPILLATIIPSIVVALTPYPKASGFLKVLSFVGQMLSFLTHKDQPGTMKLPLTANGSTPKASAALALVLCGSIVCPAGGCAWLQTHPKTAGALRCGLKEIVRAIPSVLADVASALSGGSPDWAALGKLELANTPELIACAAQELATPAAGSAINPNVSRNADAYLKARGF